MSPAVHELVTIGPSSLGTSLAVNITTAQEIWHETTSAFTDRQADLRLQLMDGAATTTADLGEGDGSMMADEGAPSGNGNVTPGIWAKGIGVWAERDADYTIAGPPPTTFNLDHDINIKGVLGGVDFGTDATPGDAILFGLLGGYTWSDLDFDAGGGSKFEGPSVGGYGTFIHGGFYADAVVKADFLDVSIDATPFGQNGSAKTNVTNVGGRLESGYKLGSTFFVEPQGSVSYMNTQFDNISLLGGQVSFNEDESLRGRAGARIGAAFGDANFSIQPDIGASVWHEFMGDNQVDVTGFSFALPTFSDSRDDTWGEVSGGISAVSHSGWSVFARGKWEFADDFRALSVHGGARIAW